MDLTREPTLVGREKKTPLTKGGITHTCEERAPELVGNGEGRLTNARRGEDYGFI